MEPLLLAHHSRTNIYTDTLIACILCYENPHNLFIYCLYCVSKHILK